MGYYDYTSYFQALITNTGAIIQNQNNLITLISVLLFIFTIFFIYLFIRNMIKSQKGAIMKKYVKYIFFIFIFLSIFFIKNISFGLTLNVTDYTELENYSNIKPLTLKTVTNSYIVEISKDLQTIRVCEPYDKSSYLVNLVSSSKTSGTYNCIRSFSVDSNTLSDVSCYASTYDSATGSWTDWTSSSFSSIYGFAPR